jgi:DnaK suppressor protein
MAKKASKKSKPAKKKATKKAVKKAVKKTTKKVSAKKKTAKKVVKKTTAKKAIKKVVAKKSVQKITKKPVAKKVAIKEVKKQAPVAKPIEAVAKTKVAKNNTAPVAKKQESGAIDSEEESGNDKGGHQSQPFFYEPPKAFIKRPDLKEPKPFIGKDKRTKYSDKELVEFKTIILGKLEEAQRDYELLKSTLSHKDDHGTDDTSPTFKLLEDGSDVMSKEETAALASRQEKYIQSLQNALIRIENKSYGICRVTGKLIPKERLRSVPHATTSIEGKMQQYA